MMEKKMTGAALRWTATVVTFLAWVSPGVANGDDWRRLMTEGKLAADLGKHDEASTAFRDIAEDEAAPGPLRWEALVRLGLVRGAAGDPAASAEAFRTVLASYADDPEAMHFLTRVVASGVPGRIWVRLNRDFEDLLRTATVVSAEELRPGGGSRKIELRQEDIELSAVWRHVSDAKSVDSYTHEVAAYEVDKMLGLDMVPPTVPRTLEGEEGSLQLWVYGCESYGAVQDRAPDTPEWRRQRSRARTFDYLIANRERNVANILVDPTWGLVLVDHTRGFSGREPTVDLPDRFDRRIVERLRQLDRSALQAHVGAILTTAQIEGILKRRDALVAHVEQLVAERGEEAVLF
jgi:hypothetical protein